jgi:putative aldouronate transport system substrate-binding protein
MAAEALSRWCFTSGSISGAYGVLSSSFQLNEDGKTVTYSMLEPGYKDWILLLKSWMDAGYIDRDCINRTSTSDTQALFTSGKAGMVYAGNWTTQQLVALGKVENPDFEIVPMPNLSLDGAADYVNPFADPIYNGQNGMYWCISSTCEHPIEALRALDYLYSYEGIELMVFGPDEWEGQQIHTTDPESGMRVFTDYMLNNPDGVPYNTIRYQYTIQNLSSEYCADMELQQYGEPINAECWDVWTGNCSNERHVPGAITMTAEESTTKINTMNNIQTYIYEKVNNIVCGEDSIDNWDSYVEEIKKMGIQNVIDAYQTACERYWAR